MPKDKQQVYKSSDGAAKLMEMIGMIRENIKFISLITSVINRLSNEYMLDTSNTVPHNTPAIIIVTLSL